MTCKLNRATGSGGRIICQEETCWGSAAEDQNAIGVEFASETLEEQINDIESQLIRGDRMRAPAQQGNQRPGGNIVGELQPNGFWPLMLKHALGGVVTTSGSGPYHHELQGDIELPEGLTLEKRFRFPDENFEFRRWRLLGAKVGEFFLEVPTEGIVQARVGLMGKRSDEPVDDLHATPSYPTNNEPFNSFHGSIKMDLEGSGTPTSVGTIKMMNLTINNSLAGEEFAIDGTAYRADLPEDMRIISGNATAMFTYDNWKIFQAFRNNTTLSLELSLTRSTNLWRIVLPAIKIRGNPTPQIPGRGPLDISFAFNAQRDDDLQTDIEAQISNDDPQITTAA